MKTKVFLQKILIIMAAMMPSMAMVSCSDEMPDLPSNPSRHDFTGVVLEIPASLIDNGSNTRGGLSPFTVPNLLTTRAEAADEAISTQEGKITSLHFFAYPVTDDGKQDFTKTVIVEDVLEKVNPLTNDYQTILADYELPVGKYKFYVVANYSFGDESLTSLKQLPMSTLRNTILQYGAPITDISNGLPMACLHENFKTGIDTDPIGDSAYEISSGENHLYVDLKFTVAKVVFNYDKKNEDPALENLNIKNISEKVNLFSAFETLSEYSNVGTESSLSLGNDNSLTLYVPEKIVAESKDMTKLSFNLEGYHDTKEIFLGDEATATESSDLPKNPTQLLRSHFYEYTLTTSSNGYDIKFNVGKWDPEVISAKLQGPAVLTVSATRLGYGEKYSGDTDEDILKDDRPVTGNTPRYVYYISDRSVTFESAKEADKDIFVLTPYEVNGQKYVRVAVNSELGIKTYEGDKKYDESYFYIKAGDLTKRIDVRYNLGGYLEVTPYIENINIVEYRRLESHEVNYEYATNYPNLKCEVSWTDKDNYLTTSDYKSGWPTGDLYGVYSLDPALNQSALGKKGIQTVTMGDTYDGYKYTKEITVKFHYTASDASAAVTKDVYLHIIPQAATTYTVYFRATNESDWTAPHIYVYTPLKKYRSESGQYEYVMTGQSDYQWENALQYSITGCLTFKGWGNDNVKTLVPGWNGTDQLYEEGYLSIWGERGESFHSEYYYYNIDYIAAHREILKNQRGVVKCDGQGCTGEVGDERKWPGVLMEKVDVNGVTWWRIELPEICRPGETLMMFSASHRGMGNYDEYRRYPLHMKPGIPLFDFPDREGWCLYDPSKPSDTHFEDDCPDGKESETPVNPTDNKVKIYFDTNGLNWGVPRYYLFGGAAGNNIWGSEPEMNPYTDGGWTDMYYIEVYPDQKVVFKSNDRNKTAGQDQNWAVVADHVYTSSGDSGKTISNYTRDIPAPFSVDIYLRGFNDKWESDYPKFTWDGKNGYYITESLSANNNSTNAKVGAATWSDCEYGKDTSDISGSTLDVKLKSGGGDITINLSGSYKYIFYKSGNDWHLKAVKQ